MWPLQRQLSALGAGVSRAGSSFSPPSRRVEIHRALSLLATPHSPTTDGDGQRYATISERPFHASLSPKPRVNKLRSDCSSTSNIQTMPLTPLIGMYLFNLLPPFLLFHLFSCHRSACSRLTRLSIEKSRSFAALLVFAASAHSPQSTNARLHLHHTTHTDMTAESFKEKGNEFFKKGDYERVRQHTALAQRSQRRARRDAWPEASPSHEPVHSQPRTQWRERTRHAADGAASGRMLHRRRRWLQRPHLSATLLPLPVVFRARQMDLSE